MRVTSAMAEAALAEVDWATLDALTDEEIQAAIASDPDMIAVASLAMENGQPVFPLPDLKALREKLGMSQKDFALAFSISKRTLENWEQGRRRLDGVVSVYLALIATFPQEMAMLLKRLDRRWNDDRRAERNAAE